MTATRRKKNSRQRGCHTHGWGSKKKHRGAGNRGGRGMAGTGKRGDAKKPSIWKNDYFGKHGFKKKNIKVKINAVTIRGIEQQSRAWLESKLIEEKAGAFTINLPKLGYNKLLSTGKATKKMNITVPYASPAAVEKIKAAGGSVEGLVEKQAKKAKKEEATDKVAKEKEKVVEEKEKTTKEASKTEQQAPSQKKPEAKKEE